jgi:hypothetical protein
MTGWLRDTKRIYDSTIYNAFVGTIESKERKQRQNIEAITTTGNKEADNRLYAQTIAQFIANLIDELEDVNTDFNDYGHTRSYNLGDLVFVWNSEAINEITKLDLPTMFHKDGLIDKFNENKLPAKYFGMPIAGEAEGVKNGSVRSLIEQTIGDVHVFAGQPIPEGITAPAGTAYKVDPSIIVKIFHRDSIPYMSAFETQTSFVNPRSLTETMFLTFGHNSLTYLRNYPMITVRYNNEKPEETLGL